MMHGQQTHFGQTPSQTVGPYFAYGLAARQYGYDFGQPYDSVVAGPHARGARIRLEGRVLDGDGAAVSDALVEIWQVDGAGGYPRHADEAQALDFRGIGRSGTGTDAQCRYAFDTVKPAAQAAGEAPHIDMIITMRGLLLHVFTRVYFDDEALANAADAVLNAVPPARRETLLARRVQRNNEVAYLFDVRMQGPGETVFFDV
ncbi:protocatechuate 3,4-dioxygenase subunit alpha [Achromobacter sp. Marseille-Q0513]|uniref:protocatechuate 3,4-dioxygenase subunit alpha n=1 Tax=Achromobacter sp. Marseille-Q0513 TaxID=2829161 RepID=UPI001B9CB614|nr:protocatechuate 3,4-dioxygenase subunit alpha [Achromobacter sp. Marseille-Q0513]MBR8655128.1 protocatechuate 3,4-dioxygenase subunit alpha [Achromobacter sp. Marseille-Q0513]